MSGRVRFVILLHSHQPVGNFDHVIDEAYEKSYLPYVEVFEKFPQIPLTHHISGCLLEWLEERRPEYFERMRAHCAGEGGGRPWEMVGGAFYEPILTMLHERDRQGQITRMAEYVEQHFGVRPRGMWLAERVWEPGLVSTLADAGVEYITLDDSHFHSAGLTDGELVGGYVTEDQGRMLRVYPASEKLRYLLPYAKVHEIINYMKELVPPYGERVVVYADDGEKFGVWPNTSKHCFEDGWLNNMLAALQQGQDEGWLVCSTMSEAYDQVESVGRVYLPENSYREMTEWALPAETLSAYEHARNDVKDDPRLKNVLPLVKGGNWRSFRVKYEEGGRMYAKMMELSAKLAAAGKSTKLIEKARTHLYRGQCNCPYWHGVFGGMYLPHLRSAIYRELIAADKLLDEARKKKDTVEEGDWDFDGQGEVKLSNDQLALYLKPSRGAHLYEFDLRDRAFNVGDTFSRRYEAYHDKVAQAIVGDSPEGAESIHEMVKAKEPGLAKLLRYDGYLRESLVDHLCHEPLAPDHLLSGHPPSDEGFRNGEYGAVRTRIGKGKNAPEGVQLIRRAWWDEREVELRKTVFLSDDHVWEAHYELDAADGKALNGVLAVEMNYSLLAGDAPDRYYYHGSTDNAGPLQTAADWGEQPFVGLKDHWLDVALTLRPSQPAHVVVAPVKTVSQSEGGFESIYQSSSVVLQWPIKLKAGANFKVQLRQEVGRA